MVADALIYHPSVAHYLRYVATTAGRDKLLRTVQYFSRFYAWYLYRTNAPASSLAPLEAIKKQFGLARKLMRVGKNVEHFRAAAVAADTKGGDAIAKYLSVGRQLGYAGYLTFDAATVLDSVGIKKWDGAKRLTREAYRAWFAGLICSALGGLYFRYKLGEREAAVSKEDGEGVVESKRIQKERAALNLQLISDLCDMTVPTAALGLANLDDGIVGLAGTVSSLIGVYGVWKKTT
ncbi:MAG: Peroxisomal membrane protein PMP27 [Claussenomyces sp. TS43310]|nr:MAG: Peroxisomal membrane protein PMP27 [Claussenomyces sp. TS43310]